MAIESLAPEVLKDLETECLPLYESLRRNRFPTWRDIDEYHEFVDLRAKLQEWAQKYGLTSTRGDKTLFVEWVMNVAVSTLNAFSVGGPRDCFYPGLPTRDPTKFPEPEFEFGPFRPTFETAQAFEERVNRAFSQFKKSYKEGVLEAEGLPQRDPIETHMKWVVERQVLGMTVEKIANSSRCESIATVSEPTRRLICYLGFKPRRSKVHRRC
jgi:hypothetical protein